MKKALVVVESPTKAKTLGRFLGKNYKILATYGHVRALPSKQGSVDVKNDFEPKYEIIPEKKKHINRIQKALSGVDALYLASDMDREGEAISYHLLKALNLDGNRKNNLVIHRIVFHEITKEAIQTAIREPREVLIPLVDAQQARVVLDYLYGFTLSPLLWKKVRTGLSAGRVQSVALRLICEREKEIKAFTPKEYWSILAKFTGKTEKTPFEAELIVFDGTKLKKFDIKKGERAKVMVATLKEKGYEIASITHKTSRKTPPPPFITSTLQQEASRKLNLSPSRTMRLAQQLYEGIDIGKGPVGLITYMRTDSVHLAKQALHDAKQIITERFGESYALSKARVYKNKVKNAQEAHEAIRPTDLRRTPEQLKSVLSSQLLDLYRFIWNRTIASQMTPAEWDTQTVLIESDDKIATFKTTGSTLLFPGYLKVLNETAKETLLPQLKEGEALSPEELTPVQHFTQPPPRYTEASLIKTLESYGIGRPSTYATVLQTLRNRDYVRLIRKAFVPQEIGMIVSDLLVNHFNHYVNTQFTARMEEQLDQIARGKMAWKPMVRDFWNDFYPLVKKKEEELKRSDILTKKMDEACPECGKPLVIRYGKYGKFIACSGFPECHYRRPLEEKTKDEPQETDQICEKCGRPMVVKRGRFGPFLACSGFPECRNTKPLKKRQTTGVPCPECHKGELVERRSKRGRTFYSCSRYPTCKFSLWNRPIAEECPECHSPYLIIKKVGKKVYKCCPDKDCGYKIPFEEQ
jgi:DNA topoisomerase-1